MGMFHQEKKIFEAKPSSNMCLFKLTVIICQKNHKRVQLNKKGENHWIKLMDASEVDAMIKH